MLATLRVSRPQENPTLLVILGHLPRQPATRNPVAAGMSKPQIAPIIRMVEVPLFARLDQTTPTPSAVSLPVRQRSG
jgi:hypothetical protein